jgi:hypothetical protein
LTLAAWLPDERLTERVLYSGVELTKAKMGLPETLRRRCSVRGFAPTGSERRVTTPLELVDVVEVPLDVEVEPLLRDPLDDPPPPEEVGRGNGVALRVGFGVGVGVGVGVPLPLADGDGVGEPESLVLSAANVAVAAPVLVELVEVDVVDPVPVDEPPVPELLLDALPPSAMVVVPCAAASVKSAWMVSEIVPLAAVAVR